MISWQNILYKIGNGLENNIDRFKLGFRQKMGWETDIQVCPYVTYANSETIYIKGRVIHDRSLDTNDNDSTWENIVNMYKRLNSYEIPGAKLKVTFSGTVSEIQSDEDGYFEAAIPLVQPLPAEELWHHPVIELLEAPVRFHPPVMARCEVMTPPVTAQFGIISDIDDTILTSHATSIFKMAYMTFLKNAYSRLPFEGVATFFRGLQAGFTGINYNPVFYISSSPWNLYDLLKDFIRINKIPAGPLLLKDYGFTHKKLFAESHLVHKTKAIRNILNAYPLLPFILIGDSGQKDPEVYAEVIKEFPGRILAAYIRDVTVEERDLEVKKIADGLSNHKVEMILAHDSYAAAEHAAAKGFINNASLKLILSEKTIDKTSQPVEEIIDKEL